MSTKLILTEAKNDISSQMRKSNGLFGLSLESAINAKVSFDYFPETVRVLELINVSLSKQAIETLKTSNISRYIVHNKYRSRIILAPTIAFIDSIEITGESEIDYLDIPNCDALTISIPRLRAIRSNLGTNTFITADEIVLMKCDHVRKLRMKKHGKLAYSAIVLNLPTLEILNAKSISTSASDCPNIIDLSVTDCDFFTSDILTNLKSVYFNTVDVYGDFMKKSMDYASFIEMKNSNILGLEGHTSNVVELEVKYDRTKSSAWLREDIAPGMRSKMLTALDNIVRNSPKLQIIVTSEKLAKDVIEDWLENGSAESITSNNYFGDLPDVYPDVEFHHK